MILVTGANGFIGRSVVKALSEENEVIALDKSAPDSSMKGINTFVECDIADIPGLERIFKQFRIAGIIHLASLLNTRSNQNPGLATRTNIMGSLNLLDLSLKYQVERFIYGSSISIYGPLDTDEKNPVNEHAGTNPSTLYGLTKKYVEFLGNKYSEDHHIDFITLRISSVIGPGATNTASPWRSEIYDRNFKGSVTLPYDRNEKLPLIFIENIAVMAKVLCQNKSVPHRIYNTPSETWNISDLEMIVRKRNPGLRFTYGKMRANDIPRHIDGSLYLNDFRFNPVSVENSLSEYY